MPDKRAFDSIKRGLLEAIDHAEGNAPAARIHNPQRFASVWDAIEDTPEDAAKMKALSAERMRQEAAGVRNFGPAKRSRENFAKGLAQYNQTAPLGTSVIETLRGGSRY